MDQRPKLTVRMVARLQGFPDSWEFSGRKTAAYRQVGNAFPPPVARALGAAIRDALAHAEPGPGAAGPGAAPAGPGRARTPGRARHAGPDGPMPVTTPALAWPDASGT